MKTKFLFFAMLLLASSKLFAQSPCNANFTFVASPTGLVTFTGTTTTSTASYFWSFGNGTSGTGINTSCQYNAPGPYTVCLTVEDSSLLGGLCIDTSCVTITISGTGTTCYSNFTATLDTAGGSPLYTYATTNLSFGTGLNYIWMWGDGTPNSNATAPSHQYTATGTYTMCLVVDNGAGCVDSSCQTINVTMASVCNASFSMSLNNSPSAPPFTYTTSNTSTGSGLTYVWSWGDGTPNTTGYNASHTFPAAGNYNVCLYISNSLGCTDSSCILYSVTSSSFPCFAYFTIVPDTSVGAAPHTYIGFNWSTGSGITYTWVWGDGTPNGTGMYPSHTYAAAGNYNICLVVMGGGCIDSFCVTQYLNKTESMVTVNFQAPAGLNEVKKNQAQLYPNPADDKLYIKGNNSTLYQVEIFNVNGSKMLSTSAKGNHAINISSLPVNLYMVKVTDAEGKSEYAKFMKQ